MKKLPMLTHDLRRLVKMLGEEGAADFATTVMQELEERVPVKTGWLSKSGMAFVGNELVYSGPMARPVRLWNRKNTVTFMFRTPKPTKGPVNYIDENGLPVFDYSIMVLERIMFYERMFHPSRMRGFVDSSFHKVYMKWLRQQ